MHAKLSPPDASRLIERPRLHKLLNDGLGGVLWVTAPAGAGKTSLLGRWAADVEAPIVWYRVDGGDADPASFFEWFALAARPSKRSDLPRYAPEHALNLPHFARRFFRAAFAAMPRGSVVVLDNVHDARAPPAAGDGAIATLLSIMVQERPSTVTLVLSSRVELEGAVTALRVDPSHRHLRWEDLRCTDDEAVTLARAREVPHLSAVQLSRAGGWMAALVVMFHQAEESGPAAWRAGSDSAVFDLFSAKAFDTLGAREQRLLLSHAFVPWIDPASADRLDATTDAHALLDKLWRAQFFIERRMASHEHEHEHDRKPSEQYICHPLLRAYLQDAARRLIPVAELKRQWLHQAQEFSSIGEADTALTLYLLAGSREAAVQLVLRQAPLLMDAGKVTTLLDWLGRVGGAPGQPGVGKQDVALDESADLAFWHGLCLLAAAPPQAIASLRQAHAGHVAQERLVPALMDVCAIVDAYFNQWDEWSKARPWVDELQRLYERVQNQPGGFLTLDVEVHVLAAGASLLFPCYDHALLPRWRMRADEILRTSSVADHHLQLAGFVIGHAWWSGDAVMVRQARRLASQAMEKAKLRPIKAFHLHMWLGIAAYSDGLAGESAAGDDFDQVLALGEAQGVHLFDFHAYCHKIMQAMSVDDTAAGARALVHARRLNPGVHGAQHLLRLCELAQLHLERNWQAAVTLGRESMAVSPDFGGWTYGAQTLRLGVAQALVMLGERDQARAQLQGPMDFARRLPSAYFDMMGHCVLAACALQEGNLADGDACLRQAFGIARDKGFSHLHPWWSPPFFAPLLTRALAAGIEIGWVTQLIRQQLVAPPEGAGAAWPYPVCIQVLGRFRLMLNGQAFVSQGKAQRRVLELLKALAGRGATAVPVQTLADDLWPELDGDAAMAAFDVTLHRARKVLGQARFLVLHRGQLAFNPDYVKLDLWDWDRLDSEIQRGLAATPAGDDAHRLRQWADTMLSQPVTPLLVDEPDEPWLRQARAHWRERMQRRLGALARACTEAGLKIHAQRLLDRQAEISTM